MDPHDPLAGLLDELGGYARVIVAPGESALAFALPVRRTPSGQRLGAQTQVILTPHLSLLTTPGPASASSRWLVVADPSEDLPGTREEATTLAARHPDLEIILGADARREEILKRWRHVDVFHFAGHGRTHHRDPWRASLLVAGGHSLGVEDVLMRPTSARLVVLNACRSGPLVERGEIGLPQVFIATGAEYVLATDSEVLDQHARAFIERFDAYAEARSLPDAYRRTMAELGGVTGSFRLWTRRL